MKFTDKYRWVDVMANLGIIGGLVLVGLQMQQNAELLKMQLLFEESRRFTALEMSMIGENPAPIWAKTIESPEELTLAERRIMEAYLWTFAEHLRSTYWLAEQGLLDEDEWRRRVDSDTRYYYGNPYASAWWRAFTRDLDDDSYTNTGYPQELAEAVDDRLRDIDENSTFNYHEDLLRELNRKKEE